MDVRIVVGGGHGGVCRGSGRKEEEPALASPPGHLTAGGFEDPIPAVSVKACSPAIWSSLLSLLGVRGPREAEEWGPCCGTWGKRAAAASEAVLFQLQVIPWVSASVPVTSQRDSCRQAPLPTGQEETQALVWDPIPQCCGWGVAVDGLTLC